MANTEKSGIMSGEGLIITVCSPCTHPIPTVAPTYQPSALMEPDTFCLVVISGQPNTVSGLDEGIFSSLGKLHADSPKDKLYVMSEHTFETYFIPTLGDIA